MEAIKVFIGNYGIYLWQGTLMTVVLSLLTMIFAIIFGVFLSFMRMSQNKIIQRIAILYVEVVRALPVLVQLSIVFYGLPLLGIQMPSFMLFGVEGSRLISAIIALTIHSTAYICEIVRSGVQSVNSGQMEGARSVGFSKAQALQYIVMPQAIKNILPALGNEFASTIKNSSQASVIGIAELMYAADKIRGISYQPFSPIIAVAVIYLILSFAITRSTALMEKKLKASD